MASNTDPRLRPDAVFRRRATSRMTSKRPMQFTIPAQQQKLTSPIPRIQSQLSTSKRKTPSSHRARQASTSTAPTPTEAISTPRSASSNHSHGSLRASRTPSAHSTPLASTPSTQKKRNQRKSQDQKVKQNTTRTADQATYRNKEYSKKTAVDPKPNNSSIRKRKISNRSRATDHPIENKQPKRSRVVNASSSVRTGADQDDEQKDPSYDSHMVRLRPVGSATRKATTLTDLDVALHTLERITHDVAANVVSKTIRRVLVNMFRECEATTVESIEMLEEQRILTQALRGAESTKRKLRQELLAVQVQHSNVAAELANAKSRFRVSEQKRQDTEDAHALLCHLDTLCVAATSHGHEEPISSTAATTAVLAGFTEVLDAAQCSAKSLRSVNQRLQRFITDS
eukprot:m.240523 g.240523  ORF g.240523 m.240523 type:complete len:399 (-) comp19416_c0_seq1:383-1579(-)